MTSVDPDAIRLLVIDKTAVMPSVRDRWERVAQEGGFALTLLAPREWIENGVTYRFDTTRTPHLLPIAGRTIFKGEELRGAYVTGLLKAYRLSRPDIVVMMEESFAIFGLQVSILHRLRTPQAPLIFYCNLITSYDLPGYRLSSLYRWIARRVTPKAALALCVNEKARSVVEESGFGVPARVLFYGIDERRFVESEQEPARRSLGIEGEGTVLIYIGRLLELKGVHDLIDAFARRRRDVPSEPIELRIVGSGPFRDQLAQRAKRSGADDAIIFHEAVSNDMIPMFIAASDILFLPSRVEINEQLGRVLIEAMFMGRLVVGSTSGGIPDVIDEGGFLFQAGDVDDLYRTLSRALDDEGESERRRIFGQTRALGRYSTEGFVKEFVAMIREFVGSPRTVSEPRNGTGTTDR